jgi:hypothetical protein
LIQYVENIKNETPNDVMLVLAGPGRTGKTTLQNDIKSYLNLLGKELWVQWPVSSVGNIIYNENIRTLSFLTGIEEIYRSRKSNQAIVNFIKFKQSFIADTTCVDKINNILTNHIKIVYMTHVF